MSVRSCRSALALAAVLSLPAVSAHATITPPARRVVAAYLEATGGRDTFEKEQTLHVKGSIHACGQVGTFESWTLAPDRVRAEVRLGPIRFDVGYDGATAWRADHATREVRQLAGDALAAAAADAYFQNELWARSDQGGGSVTLGDRAMSADGAEQALEITPPKGAARTLWFLRKSGHLVRMVTPRAHGSWTETFSSFRRSSGRVRAHGSESGDDDSPAGLQRIEVDSTWVNHPIDSSRFAVPPDPLTTMGWRPGPTMSPASTEGRRSAATIEARRRRERAREALEPAPSYQNEGRSER